MKPQTLAILLAAAASAYPHSTCKTPSQFCKYVSKDHVKRCNKLIDLKGLQVATCVASAPTVTTILIIHPTVTVTKVQQPSLITKKVYKTVTEDEKHHQPATANVTTTSTKVKKTTAYQTTEFSYRSTATVTTIETTSTSSTLTVTSTTTISWQDPNCSNKKRDIRKRHVRRAPLPAECSCFLTTTQPCQSTKTATVKTKEEPRTYTAYENNYKPLTVTEIVTVTKDAAGVIFYTPKITKTVVKTVTETDHALSTIVMKRLTTLTKTNTVTNTLTTTTETTVPTYEACSDLSAFAIDQGSGFSSVGDLSGSLTNALISQTYNVDAEGCCNACFGTTDCIYYTYQAAASLSCTMYYLKGGIPNGYCIGLSTQCPNGFATSDFDSEDDSDTEYYHGPCRTHGQQR